MFSFYPFLGLIHSCFCPPDLGSSIKSSSKRQKNLGPESPWIEDHLEEKKKITQKKLAHEKLGILLERLPEYTTCTHT